MNHFKIDAERAVEKCLRWKSRNPQKKKLVKKFQNSKNSGALQKRNLYRRQIWMEDTT